MSFSYPPTSHAKEKIHFSYENNGTMDEENCVKHQNNTTKTSISASNLFTVY